MRRAVAQGRRYRSYRRGMVLHKIVRRYERLRASKVVGLRLLGKRNRKFLSSRTCSRLCYRTSILRLWRNGYARWNAIRRGEERGGKGGKDSERSFRGKMWKGEERKVGGEDSSVSNENIVSISRSRRVERFFLFETYAEARIETSRGNIFARTKRIPISIASRFEQYFEF